MRKLFFIFVALLWIAAGIQLIQNLNKEDEEKIVEAFNQTNCMDAQSSVHAQAQLNDVYHTKKEQETILREMAEELGITGELEVEQESEPGRNVLALIRRAEKAQTILKIVSIENEPQENIIETVQYLFADIQLYDKLECAVLYKENLERIIRKYDEAATINLEFYGELPGRLQEKERESLKNHLLESISAKVREEHTSDDVYTIYAYTELVDKYEQIKGKTVNVSIAMTYDEINERTCLYLATPLLKGDY